MNSRRRDLYAVLGVRSKATQAEIKTAYRALASKLHPDCQETGDEGRFRAVQEAYEVLSDLDRRKKYDQERAQHLNGAEVGLAVADLVDVVAIGLSGSVRGAVAELIDRSRDDHWSTIGSRLKTERRPSARPGAAGETPVDAELERLRRENADLKEKDRLRRENERLKTTAGPKP